MIRSASLKPRALDAALRLLEGEGLDALSLRSIAAAIETGPASLYHHFRDKDELLAELAAEGFRALAVALSENVESRGERTAAWASCGAYVHFMRDRPMLYTVMFDERILNQQEVARRAERSAFEVMQSAIALDGSDENVALTLWALGRGTAALCMATGDPKGEAGRAVARGVVQGLEALLGHSVRVHTPSA